MRSVVTRAFAACAVGLALVLSARPCEVKPRIVQGLVTDEADAPIPGALVELDCRQKGKRITAASTKSRTDGRFEIKATLRGACKIRISHAGFSEVVIPTSDFERRPVADLGNIRLRVSCLEPGVNCDEVTPVERRE